MRSRIGYLAAFCLTGGGVLACWVAGIGLGASGEKPPAPGGVRVFRNLQYREGASKQ
jgi:hypothetical protein